MLELAAAPPPHGLTVRLIGEAPGSPAIFSLGHFEIVSAKIPESWIVMHTGRDYLELTTIPWARPGFWEAYFDRRPEAVACFEEERHKILASDP